MVHTVLVPASRSCTCPSSKTVRLHRCSGHYVNVTEGAASFDMKRDCSDGKCVVGAIERFTAVLREPNAPLEKRREALKLVTHFVGDVHHGGRRGDATRRRSW